MNAGKIKTTLPRFVLLGGETAMRLTPGFNGGLQYWLYAGAWGVGITERDGKLYACLPAHDNIHGKELTPCTYAEWKAGNGKYAPRSVKP